MRRMRNDQTETAGLDALSGGAAPAGRGLAAAEAAADTAKYLLLQITV